MTRTLLAFQDHGACRDHDPELFFPVSEAEANTAQIEQAKAVCMSCPVREDCRAYALAEGPAGIWGGMTEDERRAVRARENRAAAAEQADQDNQDVGEDTQQPEPSPTLPSYQSARQSLSRARRALDLAEHAHDADAITRAEQRVAAAEEQFAAVRTRSTSGAVA